MRYERLRPNLYFFAFFFASIAGACTTTSPPQPSELTEIEAGKRTLLLLRVVASAEGKIIEPFSNLVATDNIGVAIGTFETGGEIRNLAALRFLSEPSRAQGWAFMSVPTGHLYLAFLPPRRSSVWAYQATFKYAKKWHVEVPRGRKLIYAGTLVVDGDSGFLIFGGSYLSYIRHMEIRDEREVAKALVEQHLPRLVPIEAVLMQRHQGPRILTGPAKSPEKP